MYDRIIKYVLFFLYSFNLCAMLSQDTSERIHVLVKTTTFPDTVTSAIVNRVAGLCERNFDVNIYADKQGDTKHLHPFISKYDLLNKTSYGAPPDNLDNYDIIFAQTGNQGAKIAQLKQEGLLTHPKIVATFTGSDCSSKIKKNPHLHDQLFAHADLLLPVCNYFKKKLVDLGCDAEKIQVQHSSIDLEKFTFKPHLLADNAQEITLATIGRLVEKKGIKYTLLAIAQLKEQYPKIKFIIGGAGKLEYDLKELTEDLQLKHNVEFLGKLNPDQVKELLEKADLFVHPSITTDNGGQEGIPNSVKEAMARGVLTISTDSAGISELITHGKSGFLAAERDADALADMIQYALHNTHLWYTMEHNARETIEKEYDMNTCNNELARLLSSLINKETYRIDPSISRDEHGYPLELINAMKPGLPIINTMHSSIE